MQIAMRKAEEARRRLGTELEAALEAAGLEILLRPLAGRLREFYSGDFIVIADRLPVPERRELAAHALGHHLLHEGNQYHQQGRTYSRPNYQERQADVFAAFFLIPDEIVSGAAAKMSELTNSDDPVSELAAKANVTPRFANFRLALHRAREEALR